MTARPGTAQEPVFACIDDAALSTNWPMSRANSSYSLYFNKNFEGVLADGDTLGLVGQIITLARMNNAGVTQITVNSHRVHVMFSAAISRNEVNKLLQTAVLRAGIPLRSKR